MRPIGELLMPVRRPVSVEPDTIYREIGIRSHCKGIFHKPETTGKQIGDKRVFWVEPGCLVFNIVFAWEQAVAMTTDSETGMIASHRFPMYRSRNGKLLPEYAWRYFSTPRGKYDLNIASPGGAGRNKTLGQEEFKHLKMPVPPVEYQREVVAVLSTTDRAIAVVEKLIAAKRKLKQGLAQQLLTGQRRLPGFGRPCSDGGAPKHWTQVKLKDIVRFRGGVGFPEADQGKYPGGIPFIKVSDLSLAGNEKYIEESANSVAPELAEKHGWKPFPSGSVVFAKVGAALLLNRRRILRKPTLIDNNLMVAIPASRTKSEFLYLLLLRLDMARLVSVGALPSVNQSQIGNISISLPPLEEQNRIAAVLGAADREIALRGKKLAALRELKKGLMQQLLSGQALAGTTKRRG